MRYITRSRSLPVTRKYRGERGKKYIYANVNTRPSRRMSYGLEARVYVSMRELL